MAAPNGTAHHSAKLNPTLVRAIRQLAEDGVPLTHIAEQFGVSVATISHVVSRKTWKHVK